jgi:hypothetical protein
MFIAMLGVLCFMRRYLNFPTEEDFIFSECILVAECLSRNDRRGAQREIPRFLNSLAVLSRNWFNFKRNLYSPEFSILKKNNRALRRMVMFTSEYEIDRVSEMFVGFGLSLERRDYPRSFRNLKNLADSSKEYKPMGIMERFLGGIERYPTVTTQVISVIVTVISVILFIVGYHQIASMLHG